MQHLDSSFNICLKKKETRSFWLYVKECSFEKSKKEDKDQESIQSSTTLDPGYQWESDNVTIRYQWESDNVTIRHLKREPRGQAFPSR